MDLERLEQQMNRIVDEKYQSHTLKSMLGLERNTVNLVEYNPDWPLFYEQEKKLLSIILKDKHIEIQHVGSTSIPGCTCKPIIDICVSIRNFEVGFITLLREIGYDYQGEYGIKRRHFFTKGNPIVTHHLHICEFNCNAWNSMILFRDYMSKNPELVQHYVNLKKELSQKYSHDRNSYTSAKGIFINRILEEI
jgi:GrpB-like predicted nucleotidyltransferase (UPF0157 family)